MPSLIVERLVKEYGLVRAIDDVSFEVKDGEFLTLLGPSGCGKSTTLGAIAGLDRPTSGRITLGDRRFFDGEDDLFVPPEKRAIGLVFQSYALWPHMTVKENLEFPLKLRKVAKAERDRRIEETLDLVEMGPYADRHPHALSGGQQQRVALARTLVYQPSLLLLDEPLSNLDAKLRERARIWLRQMQTRIGVTTVYVTHDQSEALALSDRIAVMNAGKIVQLDEPRAIYRTPADPFVADFIGSSNFVPGTVASREDRTVNITIGKDRTLVANLVIDLKPGDPALVAVRPERIEVLAGLPAGNKEQQNVFPARIETRSFLGARHMCTARLDDLTMRIESDEEPQGDEVFLRIPTEASVVFRGNATP